MPPRRHYSAAQLRDLIRAGLGADVDTAALAHPLIESELMRAYSASRLTVREALALLADEGLVSRRPGLGTIPNPGSAALDLTLPPDRGASTIGQFHGWVSPLIGWDVIDTPRVIRRRPGSDWPDECLRVTQLGQRDRVHPRLAHVTYYIRLDVGRRLDRAQVAGDMWEALIAAGADLDSQTMVVRPSTADPVTARYLDVTPGDPLLTTEHDLVDSSQRLVCVAFATWRHDVRISLRSGGGPSINSVPARRSAVCSDDRPGHRDVSRDAVPWIWTHRGAPADGRVPARSDAGGEAML